MASKTQKLLEEVRTQVARVRERLLHPCSGTLEPVAPELQQAIHLLRQNAALPQGQALTSPAISHPAEESLCRESARRLGQELALVQALARQANEFYSLRIRLLAPGDSSLCYSRNGLAGRSLAEMAAEAPQPQGESVLHG